VKEESAGEMGTSFAEMNRSDNSNAKKGPTKDFNAFKDFHESETIASILAAWMEFTGMDGIEGKLINKFTLSCKMYHVISFLSDSSKLFVKICQVEPSSLNDLCLSITISV